MLIPPQSQAYLNLSEELFSHIYLFARSAQQVFGLLLRSPGQWVRQYPLSDTIRVSGLIKSWYKKNGTFVPFFYTYSSTNFTVFFSEIGCNCDDNTNIFTFLALSFLSREIFVSSFIESGTLSIPIITPFSSYIAAYT